MRFLQRIQRLWKLSNELPELPKEKSAIKQIIEEIKKPQKAIFIKREKTLDEEIEELNKNEN